jgi:anaerobic selenocysteine-containing dehydrogenase
LRLDRSYKLLKKIENIGIILKVKDNQVIGFDPWEAFPFNEGKLCPKGVKLVHHRLETHRR